MGVHGPGCHGPSWLVQHCVIESDGSLTVSDLEVRGPRGTEQPTILVGIQVERVTLRNITIEGYSRPIMFSILGYGDACNPCHVHLQNVTVRGPPEPSPDGAFGIFSMAGEMFHVTIDGMSIAGFEKAISYSANGGGEFLARNLHVDCAGTGLDVSARLVVLDSVTVQGCRGMGAYFSSPYHRRILDPPLADVRILNSTILDNGMGIMLERMGSVKVDRTLFARNEIGGLHSDNNSLTVSSSTFHANGAGLGDLLARGFGARTFTADTSWVGNCFEEQPVWGLYVQGGETVANGNWWNSTTGPRRALSVDGSPLGGNVPGGDSVPANVLVTDWLTARNPDCPPNAIPPSLRLTP